MADFAFQPDQLRNLQLQRNRWAGTLTLTIFLINTLRQSNYLIPFSLVQRARALHGEIQYLDSQIARLTPLITSTPSF